MGAKRMVFRAWAHERAPLDLQWLVLRIGGSIVGLWLERAESLITKL